jgi:integrase
MLLAHRAGQAEAKGSPTNAYQDNDLVCCREDGSPWPPSAFTSTFRALLQRRKMTGIRFHDLRHSHVSQLLRSGVSPKVISERLGHSKVGFTLDTYSHLLPGMADEVAPIVDAELRAELGKAK